MVDQFNQISPQESHLAKGGFLWLDPITETSNAKGLLGFHETSLRIPRVR